MIADGFSARRVRYLNSPPTREAAEIAVASNVLAQPDDSVDDAAADNAEIDNVLVEIEAVDLEPLYSGAPLGLDLALHAQGYRFALRLSGRAEDSSGALRVAGGQFEAAFGPQGDDDEALQAQGTVDLSLLAAGGLRGEIAAVLEDPRWLAELSGLALQQALRVQVQLDGQQAYETDLAATINSEELQLEGRWPIGGDPLSREAYLRGDYAGSDGVTLEGLELVRESPAQDP